MRSWLVSPQFKKVMKNLDLQLMEAEARPLPTENEGCQKLVVLKNANSAQISRRKVAHRLGGTLRHVALQLRCARVRPTRGEATKVSNSNLVLPRDNHNINVAIAIAPAVLSLEERTE
jgi:hypothetical protein